MYKFRFFNVKLAIKQLTKSVYNKIFLYTTKPIFEFDFVKPEIKS